MDARSTYTVSVYPQDADYNGPDTRSWTIQAFINFILEFHLDNVFIYRYECITIRREGSENLTKFMQ